MRFARLLLVSVVVIVAMSCGVAAASAQVEVTDEATGVHCSSVSISEDHIVSGGCRIRAVSEVETQVQAFVSGLGFVTISTCEEQFEAAVGEDGTGALYNAVDTEHLSGGACTYTQCDEPDMSKRVWEFHFQVLWFETTWCKRRKVDPEGTAGAACATRIPFQQVNHTLEFTATGAAGSGSCENLGGGVRVIGHWVSVADESHPAIEIG